MKRKISWLRYLQSHPKGPFWKSVVLSLGVIGVLVVWSVMYLGTIRPQLRAAAHLRAFLDKPRGSVSFTKDGAVSVVADKEQVSIFRSIIGSSTPILAHHSSPVRGIRFSFPNDETFYILSHDSDVSDEYWLEENDDSIPSTQFRSKEMTEWLERNHLSEHKP